MAMANESYPAKGPAAADLIRAVARERDKTAFASLFEFYAPRTKAMLMRMGIASELAEDIAQETMVTVWRKAELFDPLRASAAAWIYTIARNLRIDRLRRDHRARLHAVLEIVEQEAPDRTDAPLDADERSRRVGEAVGTLSQEQMRVIELSFFDGLAHGDIADRLGVPLGTVKSRLRLAMARLREALDDLR
jgi:RNA polymerase sigma-70 factor (ECF subfamily)